MRIKTRATTLSAATLALLCCAGGSVEAQSRVTSPEGFFGFQLGADRKMARWDRIVEYLGMLERESGGRMKVMNMGPTTMGNPFLAVVISSRDNLSRLDRLRQVNARLSDPRGIPEDEIAKLVGEGKAVICQSMSLHASEVGGTQMAPELIYDLLARDDDEARRIRDNVLSFIVPSFNPDGNILVADWYAKTLGTEYEGSTYPSLFNKYVGHDNNRDAFQSNMVESQYMARLILRDWIPQAYVDHHQQYSYGARIYLPPYADPIRPFADPLVWRELNWYGAHMSYREEAAGQTGALNGSSYPAWGHFGFNWMTPFHNIAGMLTEAAHAKAATPIYIHPEQLRGDGRGLPAYDAQTNFPSPWPGGWWRLRDVLDRQKVAAWAVLDLAARNKDIVLRNAYLKAKHQTERGAGGSPAAYVIPATQHDPPTAALMINKLLGQGVEVHDAPAGFAPSGGRSYPAGSWVVSLAQPKMGVIRHLLGRTTYPDNTWTRSRDGAPLAPYDLATDTMFEFMGVHVDAVDEAVDPKLLRKVVAPLHRSGTVARGAYGYVFEARLNESFRALNLLLGNAVSVERVVRPQAGAQPGDFVVTDAPVPILAAAARETGVDFRPLGSKIETVKLQRLRIGMYRRYRGGSTDEGWTRWILEQYGFPYTTLWDAEIKGGALTDQYDLIILPNDSPAAITGDLSPAAILADQAYPPEYRSGLGAAGVAALKIFVENGGTLLTMGDACRLPIEKFGLALRDVTAGKSPKEFYCPGSTLKAAVDSAHPLAYGMPREALATYLGGNPAFEVLQGPHNERYETVVRYANRDLLASGWLVGEQTLAGKAAMVVAQIGRGRAVLIGFRPQHRGQTHGTFKLLFNALVR
jgi:hypothetical protein